MQHMHLHGSANRRVTPVTQKGELNIIYDIDIK